MIRYVTQGDEKLKTLCHVSLHRGRELKNYMNGEGSEGGAGLMKGGMGRPRMEVEMGVVPKVASLKIAL